MFVVHAEVLHGTGGDDTATVAVASTTLKLKPAVVMVRPPVVGPFTGPVEVTTGASKVRPSIVPVTVPTIALTVNRANMSVGRRT